MIIGVIGPGSIGMRHAKNLLAMGHVVLGYDIAEHPIGDFGIEWIPTTEGVLEKSDAVVIATPSDQHTIDMYCCFQNKPTFVEKPIGVSQQCVLDIEAMLKHGNKTIMVGNNMRYHPVVKLAKERVDRMGPPSQSWFRILQKNTKYTDPVILNWGAHEVDLALYLVDKNLQFDAGDVTQDSAVFSLKSDRHSVGVHLDYLAEPWVRDFALHWPDTSIYADVQNFKVTILKTGDREIMSREVIAVEGSHDETYKAEMEEFIRRVEGHSTDGIGATGEDGLRCLKLLLEAQKS